jgi:hypothetical protein
MSLRELIAEAAKRAADAKTKLKIRRFVDRSGRPGKKLRPKHQLSIGINDQACSHQARSSASQIFAENSRIAVSAPGGSPKQKCHHRGAASTRAVQQDQPARSSWVRLTSENRVARNMGKRPPQAFARKRYCPNSSSVASTGASRRCASVDLKEARSCCMSWRREPFSSLGRAMRPQ